jgi:HK97 family phage prohead protease
MQNRAFKFEIKSVNEQGVFTGMASVFGNMDLGGDVVEPGAFARTLAHKGGEVPILFAHDTRQPIGLGKVIETAKGLEVTGSLVMETRTAQETFALMKKGVLKGLSIGYDVVRDTVTNGVRHLQELKLYEISVVCFPMNELATVTAVKSSEEADQVLKFRRMLAECKRSF